MNDNEQRPYELFDEENIVYGKFHLLDETEQECDLKIKDNADFEDVFKI